MMIIYHHRIDLIKALLKEGYEVIVVCPEGEEKDKLMEAGCKVIIQNIKGRTKNPLKEIKIFIELLRICKSIKPDVILTFYTKTNIYGSMAARISGVPYVVNVTGLGSVLAKESFFSNITRKLYKMAICKASMVFFQNSSNQRFFKERKIYEGPFEMLAGSGVNLNQYSLLPYPSTDRIEFLFISRILKEKGIEEYIKAAEIVKEKYPDMIFHVVGPFEDDLVQFIHEAEQNGVIQYHGKIDDITNLIKDVHCTVLPSYYAEGIANVLLESASSGRPVITTDLPGCRETVENGVTGYTVPAKDAETLAHAMIKFIELPLEKKRQLGLAGRKKMEKEFDRDNITRSYLEAVETILSGL